MVDNTFYFNLGLTITAFGIGTIGAGFLRHLTGLRTLIPRLFDEYKQDRIQETLKEFDNNIDTTSKFIVIGISLLALGLAVSGLIFVSQLNL
ncbi:MAG: hypothetical protein ACW991_00500 [Candidatus Hodarchaeales archaeon]|jgi:hypothetical protein